MSIRRNLANLEHDRGAQERLLGEVRARFESVLGPTHPEVLSTRVPLALLIRDRKKARAELDEVCRAFERWQHRESYALCAFEAAWLADEDGDRAAAQAWMLPATEQPGDLKPRIAAAFIAVASNSPQRASLIAQLERGVANTAPNPWSRLGAADALAVIATVDPRAWERAVSMFELVDQPYYSRRLARARRMLAEYWRRTRPADARRLATLALEWYRNAPGDEAVVQRLDAIAAPPR